MRTHVMLWPCLALSAALVAAAPARAQEKPPVVRVGMVVDGPWDRNPEIRALFQNEIQELTRREFDVRFPDERYLVADWTPAGVKRAMDELLADREVDMILALGVMATADAGGRGPLPKPVVAPIGINVELQGLPFEGGTSGTRNLTYLLLPRTLARDLAMFREIVPFQKAAILFNAYLMEGLPGFGRLLSETVRSLEMDIDVIPVHESAQEALDALTDEFDAVYIAPVHELPDAEFDRLIHGLIERKLPTFSYFGEKDVERGVLAGLNPDIFPRLARRTAINVQRILLGDEPGSIQVAFAPGERLTLNMATARAIDFSPGWAVLTEARILNEHPSDEGRVIALREAVEEAVQRNPTLAAARRSVEAGAQQVNQTRAPLLPQIHLSARGQRIDEDRAEASFGAQPERSLVGGASLDQVIYSEEAWTGYVAAKHTQTSREFDLRRERLDTMQDAAEAYLQILAAKSIERIQKDNLTLTRTNLEMAEVRVLVGYAGPEEVYRWESQIAGNRIAVIDAGAARNLTLIDLNRILDRPQEEPFRTIETGIEDAEVISSDPRFDRLVGNKRDFHRFRDFMVSEGFAHSPELRSIEALIAAQKRVLAGAKRVFWLPTFSLFADVTERLATAGAGSGGVTLPGPPGLFPRIDDTDWSVGVGASYPLFVGAGKFAAKNRAAREVEALDAERRALANAIEQRIRSALHVAGSSFAAIEQSRLATEASEKNLELVSASYARGAVSIIDLIDAQNAVLVARETESNTLYQFLIDYVEVERSIGRFYSFGSAEDREDFLGRALQFVTR